MTTRLRKNAGFSALGCSDDEEDIDVDESMPTSQAISNRVDEITDATEGDTGNGDDGDSECSNGNSIADDGEGSDAKKKCWRPSLVVVLVSLAASIALLVDGSLYSTIPANYQSIGLQAWQVGVILSANRWVRLATNHSLQKAYQWKPTQLMVLCVLVSVAVNFLYILPPPFAVFLILRLLWGMAWSVIRCCSVDAVVMFSKPAEFGRSMGTRDSLTRIGFFGGNLLGGILFDAIGYHMCELTLSVMSAFSIPMMMYAAVRMRRSAAFQNRVRKPVPPLLRSIKAYWGVLYLGMAVGIVGPGMIMASVGLILREQVGDSFHGIPVTTLSGLFLAARWGVEVCAGALLGYVADRVGHQRAAIAYLALGASCLLAAAWFLPVAILVFFASTGLSAINLAHVSESSGAYFTFMDLGSAMGPMIAWLLAQNNVKATAVFYIGAVVYAIGCAIACLQSTFAPVNLTAEMMEATRVQLEGDNGEEVSGEGNLEEEQIEMGLLARHSTLSDSDEEQESET